MDIVRMSAWQLAGPLPTDLPVITEGLKPVTDPDDLPLHLSGADTYKAWRIGPAWYVWMHDHYRIFCADLDETA